MSAAAWSEPYDPHERVGTVRVEDTPTDDTQAPVPAQQPVPSLREHVLTIRVYDYCPEFGYHIDPEIQTIEGL